MIPNKGPWTGVKVSSILSIVEDDFSDEDDAGTTPAGSRRTSSASTDNNNNNNNNNNSSSSSNSSGSGANNNAEEPITIESLEKGTKVLLQRDGQRTLCVVTKVNKASKTVDIKVDPDQYVCSGAMVS